MKLLLAETKGKEKRYHLLELFMFVFFFVMMTECAIFSVGNFVIHLDSPSSEMTKVVKSLDR